MLDDNWKAYGFPVARLSQLEEIGDSIDSAEQSP